jgi:hypothetical protein
MKTDKNIEKELARKALQYPEDSPERLHIVTQICRLYDPKGFPVFDESIEQVEF